MYNFKFADIGEGIHDGVILSWKVQVGDKVNDGDTLCVIETDKVNAEIPSPVDGVIKELGAKEGETVHVGETLAMIDDGTSTAEPEIKEETVEESPEVKEETNGSIHRRTISPSDDTSSESAEIKALVAEHHTDELKTAYLEQICKTNHFT